MKTAVLEDLDTSLRRISDWTLLSGAYVEVRQYGQPIARGRVDSVTDDGEILWLQPLAENRRLYERAEFFEAWATETRSGFHYEVAKVFGSLSGEPSWQTSACAPA